MFRERQEPGYRFSKQKNMYVMLSACRRECKEVKILMGYYVPACENRPRFPLNLLKHSKARTKTKSVCGLK